MTMPQLRTRSLGLRVLKFLLGTDDPSFVAAAAGVCLALGNIIIFQAIYFGICPISSIWQAVGVGLMLGLFLLPFFFMAVARASWYMSPWEALSVIAAASLCPLMMSPLRALGVSPLVTLFGCIAFVFAAFLVARLVSKHPRS